jgi:hypothetical protein
MEDKYARRAGNRGCNFRPTWIARFCVGFLLIALALRVGKVDVVGFRTLSSKLPEEESLSLYKAATFPLVLAPRPQDGEPSHINLLEQNDGFFNEAACSTWKHTDDQGPFKRFNCGLEWDEWMLVNAFVKEGDVVIEFGARYGTTSCMLSRAVGKTGHAIAVEVDESVQGYLLLNRHAHRCNYHAVLGSVSTKDIYLGGLAGYALFTSTEHKQGSTPIPRIDVTTIEHVLQRKINVALIDCEGCIDIVEENGMFDRKNGVDLILMEEDRTETVDYAKWHEKLVAYGYECLWYTKGSMGLRHSVWRHQRVRDQRVHPTCEQYLSDHAFADSKHAIVCGPLPIIGDGTTTTSS